MIRNILAVTGAVILSWMVYTFIKVQIERGKARYDQYRKFDDQPYS